MYKCTNFYIKQYIQIEHEQWDNSHLYLISASMYRISFKILGMKQIKVLKKEDPFENHILYFV